MKHLILIVVASVCMNRVYAQPPGNWQRQTPEERVAVIHFKLDSAFKLAPATLSTLDTALTVLYKKQDEKMKAMMEGTERPDREAMMALRKKYSDARDEMIKAMVSAEQFIIWKEQIEPAMRPQRPGGGNRN